MLPWWGPVVAAVILVGTMWAGAVITIQTAPTNGVPSDRLTAQDDLVVPAGPLSRTVPAAPWTEWRDGPSRAEVNETARPLVDFPPNRQGLPRPKRLHAPVATTDAPPPPDLSIPPDARATVTPSPQPSPTALPEPTPEATPTSDPVGEQTTAEFKAWAALQVGTEQFPCLNSLWERESGWDHHAKNPTSGAYGIPQSLPASKMAEAGADWETNGYTQMKWGLSYISATYGSPCAAWEHFQTNGNY